MSDILTKKELIKLAKQLATPVNFELLERKGIIEKKGAWYKIKNINGLPDYASQQIREIKNDGKGNCLVKFPQSWKKAQQLYRRLTGKEIS